MEDVYQKGICNKFKFVCVYFAIFKIATFAKISSDLKIIGVFPNNRTFQSQSCIVHEK